MIGEQRICGTTLASITRAAYLENDHGVSPSRERNRLITRLSTEGLPRYLYR